MFLRNANTMTGTLSGIRRVLWVTMGLNVIPTVAKLVVGYFTNSLSLIADGFDSVFDTASNVVGLVGVWVAGKPASKDYPYGRRKAETITALIISYLLFITTWELVKSAVERFLNPALLQAEVNAWSFIALGISIGVHLYVVHYELSAGRKLKSDVLIADAKHTRADVFVSISVLLGLVFVSAGVPLADPILAIIVAGIITNIGVNIIRESTPTLLDKVAMPADKVEQIVLSVPGIRSVHNVRSRGHEQAVYADLHIQIDPAMSTERGHAIAHEVKRRLREFEPDLQDVTIHIEPSAGISKEVSQESISLHLRRLALGLGMTIHDVWAREVHGQYFIETHVEEDGTLPLRQAHALASKFEDIAKAEIPHIAEITTHIEPKGNLAGRSIPALQEVHLAELVKNVVHEIAPTVDCHNVRFYRNEERLMVSLHIHLAGDQTLAEAHRMSSEIEIQLRERLKGVDRVLIHTEPR